MEIKGKDKKKGGEFMPHNGKTVPFMIRLGLEEKAMLEAQAGAKSLPMSQYIRFLIREIDRGAQLYHVQNSPSSLQKRRAKK